MQTLKVNLGERSYTICLGVDLLGRCGALLQQTGCGEKAAIVTHPQVARLYLKPVEESLRRAGFKPISLILPEGEAHKNLQTVSAIYDRLISERFERRSVLLALGGGVVGDVTGFAAATYLRGIPYVQIPTTLLAQVDSSVGGKTGVNHGEGKNLIGAFYQPRLVIIDVSVLRTLPRRELLAGLAEVIKYAIIEDADLFSRLEKDMGNLLSGDSSLLLEVVRASCAIKARVIEKDEREDDYRSILNFGHTVGHALEAATGYEALLHGEAVAIGMAKAAGISARLGRCDEASRKRILELIVATGLPYELPAAVPPARLLEHMEVDKKAHEGKIKFVCCTGIGQTRFEWLSPADIASALEPR